MIQAAKGRGLNAFLMSADDITFENAFDAVFTNAALHWVTKYDAVIKGVYKALKPSGRFVGEFGGKGNIEQVIVAMKTVMGNNKNMGEFHNPWYFPDTDEYRSALEKHGFSVTYIELIPRPTPLKTGLQEWLKIFANHTLAGMTPEQEEAFLEETEKLVKPSLYSEASGWSADYVRLRFRAIKS
jgi:2-isopropylmalate synthase